MVVEIIQGLIALAVVLGAGFAIISGNPHWADLMPVVTLVLGYYFGKTRPIGSEPPKENPPLQDSLP